MFFEPALGETGSGRRGRGERLLEDRRDARALPTGGAAGGLHGGALDGERELLLHARAESNGRKEAAKLAGNLATVLPNIGRSAKPNLGFMG
jgi:hypothetical protein